MRARAGGGQARRGATALSNKQQGEKGRAAAKGGGRGEDWLLGQGRREGLRHARGQVAGDPSASETRSSCGAELTADSEPRTPSPALRSHVPCSPLRPRAQGKEGRGVQPSSERGPAGVPGAVRRPQATTFSPPRPFRVSSASWSPGRAARKESGPSAIPAFAPRHVGSLSPSFSQFPHPRAAPGTPHLGLWGRRRVFHPHQVWAQTWAPAPPPPPHSVQ